MHDTMPACGCKPDRLCWDHAEAKRNRERPRIQAAQARLREKRRKHPAPCANCRETKPLMVVRERLCAACYIYRDRHGTDRPAMRAGG